MISLRVLKNISLVRCDPREIFFSTQEEKFCISSGHVMFYLLYKHQWNTKRFHFSCFFGGVKGAIYHVAIATVTFSHVKISSCRAKAHLVFHWCLYNKWLSLPFWLPKISMIRSMSFLTSKSHQKVSQPSLYLHNKNASFDSSVLNSAFQNWPQRLFWPAQV